MKCLKCGKEIKTISLGEDDPEKFYRGIVEKVYPGYGSNHDGEETLICVCDDCLSELKIRNNFIR